MAKSRTSVCWKHGVCGHCQLQTIITPELRFSVTIQSSSNPLSQHNLHLDSQCSRESSQQPLASAERCPHLFDQPSTHKPASPYQHREQRSDVTMRKISCITLLPQRSANIHSLLDHYSAPRNVGKMDKNAQDVGTGLVGAPACGDVMKLQIQVDPATNTISDVKFKTFGCGSAIASSSYLTELVRGMTLEDAGKVRNTEIARELCLPPVKRTFTPCRRRISRIERLMWKISTLLHARGRRDQIGHLELLHQEPQG